MANKPENTARERIGSSSSSSSRFLGCFGFSGKKSPEKPIKSSDGDEKKKRKKKKNRLFSWLKFRFRKGEIKPSPIDETEKPNSNAKKNESDKHKTVPVISRLTYQKNLPVGDKASKLVTQETNANRQRDIFPDRSESADLTSSSKGDTCQRRIPTSVSGKPDPAVFGSDPKKRNRVGKFDRVVGISILMLTLAIMLIWGRMCAILCASAWCYFLPRIRDAAAAKRKRECCGGAESVSDLDSEAYKKKVILEGFLGRNYRVSSL